MIPFDRIMAARARGLYESHYLKANCPSGERALWIKHNVWMPETGPGAGEFWAIGFRRGRPPVVTKREVPWDRVSADPDRVSLACGSIALDPEHARGDIADVRWDLRLSGGGAPLVHLPSVAMYDWGFPKKKLLTPAPNLRFDGVFALGDDRWDVSGWIGLRGHNWGSAHAWRYAYGSCNLWDDGDALRAVDGFTAQLLLGGRPSPWLSSVVGHAPELRYNRLRHWPFAGEVTVATWRARWWRPWKQVSVAFVADPASYAGLRYRQPDGRETFCYNTKFADVTLDVSGARFGSRCGELEVLFPDPIPGIPLHPTPGWKQQDGDYRSG